MVGLPILHDRRTHMRWVLAAAFAVAVSFALAPAADAKGCIKGAIVGGVAGHMAGHGKLGAAAGCVVGHHEANRTNAQVPSDQKESGREPAATSAGVYRRPIGPLSGLSE